MQIKTTYIGTLNGIHGIWCGFKPKKAQITEEKSILFPEQGYKLKNKINNEEYPYVCLIDGDSQENYEEIEIIEDNKA